ncbi:MAG: hypothetical protein H8E47_08635 [Anaerolineales bacterium]|nr:hypothetical protein [Anaerolineales bacterium]
MAKEWISPTGWEGTGWLYPERAYDEDINTGADDYVNDRTWSAYLILLHSPLVCDKVQVYLYPASVNFTSTEVDVYRDGEWVSVYSDGQWIGWKTIEFDEGIVEKMRVRSYNNHFSNNYHLYVREVDFWGEEPSGAQPYSYIM